VISLWIPSIRRILISVGAYAVAIVIHDVPTDDVTFVYVVAGLMVLGLVVADEYCTNVRPAKRVEELAPMALDGLAEPFLSQLKTDGITARINLMIVRRTWRGLWLCRYFKMAWSKGMENQPDVNISFRVRYGVTGACFRTRQPVYAAAALLKTPEFALPEGISQQIPDLQAVLSYPVYEPARKGRPQSGKLIGVLNLDSITKDAYNLIMAVGVFDQMNATMQNIAGIAARFYD
jgi:hypothetical protein